MALEINYMVISYFAATLFTNCCVGKVFEDLFGKIPVALLSTCKIHYEPSRFHVPDILATVKNVKWSSDCISACKNFRKCVAVNFVAKKGMCFLLGGTAEDKRTMVKMKSLPSEHFVLSCLKEFSNPVIDHGVSPLNCGLSHDFGPRIRSKRIKGGLIVHPPYAYPWLGVVLEHNKPSCGVNLISTATRSMIQTEFGITTAHCVVDLDERAGRNRIDKSKFKFVFGIHDTRFYQPHSVTVKAKYISPHPTFNVAAPLFNDIALVRFDQPIKFNFYIRPICLPLAESTESDELRDSCIVAGFGDTSDKEATGQLHQMKVPIIDHEHAKVKIPHFDQLTMIAIGSFTNEDFSSHYGDSGSALSCSSRNGQHTMIGVNSFSWDRPGLRGVDVCTNVTSFLPWIMAQLLSEH